MDAAALVAERLAELYPEVGAARRLLALAGVDARRVALGGGAGVFWWAAVVEAAHQGKLRPLVEAALEDHPLDEWLWAAEARLRQVESDKWQATM